MRKPRKVFNVNRLLLWFILVLLYGSMFVVYAREESLHKDIDKTKELESGFVKNDNYPGLDKIKTANGWLYTYTVDGQVFTSEKSHDEAWLKAMSWQYEQGLKTKEEIEFEYGRYVGRNLLYLPPTESSKTEVMMTSSSDEIVIGQFGWFPSAERVDEDEDGVDDFLPLIDMKVELWCKDPLHYENPKFDKKIAETKTDENGYFVFTDISNWDNPIIDIESNIDVYARVYPESDTFKVNYELNSIVDFLSDAFLKIENFTDLIGKLNSYNYVSDIISLPYPNRSGNFGTILIPYGEITDVDNVPESTKIYRSFMIAQALAMGQDFINDRGLFPTYQVYVAYPALKGIMDPSDAFCYTDNQLGAGLMCIGLQSDDWETLLHEYGHYVQGCLGIFPFHWTQYLNDFLNFSNGVDPVHNSQEDHIYGRGKDEGSKFAWSEGWVQAFSYIVQREKWTGYYVPGKTLQENRINGVILKNYIEIGRFYNSIDENSCEGQEKAITTFLYQLYRQSFFGVNKFWSSSTVGVGTSNKILTFSDYAKYLKNNYSNYSQEIAQIMEKCQLAPGEVQINFDSQNPPILSWYVNGSQYTPLKTVKIVFNVGGNKYITNYITVSSSHNVRHNYRLPSTLWQEILKMIDISTTLYISVEGYNSTTLMTGPYTSKNLEVLVEFEFDNNNHYLYFYDKNGVYLGSSVLPHQYLYYNNSLNCEYCGYHISVESTLLAPTSKKISLSPSQQKVYDVEFATTGIITFYTDNNNTLIRVYEYNEPDLILLDDNSNDLSTPFNVLIDADKPCFISVSSAIGITSEVFISYCPDPDLCDIKTIVEKDANNNPMVYHESITTHGETKFYKFRPLVSGNYNFKSNAANNGDTYMELYDRNGNLLATDDNSGPTWSAKITYYLTSGLDYYISVRYKYYYSTGQYDLEVYNSLDTVWKVDWLRINKDFYDPGYMDYVVNLPNWSVWSIGYIGSVNTSTRTVTFSSIQCIWTVHYSNLSPESELFMLIGETYSEPYYGQALSFFCTDGIHDIYSLFPDTMIYMKTLYNVSITFSQGEWDYYIDQGIIREEPR